MFKDLYFSEVITRGEGAYVASISQSKELVLSKIISEVEMNSHLFRTEAESHDESLLCSKNQM